MRDFDGFWRDLAQRLTIVSEQRWRKCQRILLSAQELATQDDAGAIRISTGSIMIRCEFNAKVLDRWSNFHFGTFLIS